MKVWILQHTPDSPPGTTIEWLEKRGLDYSVTQYFEAGFKVPKFEDYDFLIVCGGAMNVDEESKYPWMRPEKDLILRSIKENKKVVGLCLGGQLIAEVLGAKVGRHPDYELGWFPLKLQASPDFKIPKVSEGLMAFEYHGYSFETPAGATRFASSEACQNQGFTFGKNAIGFQFHPESTQEWVNTCSEEKVRPSPFVQKPEVIRAGNKHQPQLKDWYFQILDQMIE